MDTTAVETIPQRWDDARDVPFFRITADLFPPAFCMGSSVLLASYDDDAPVRATVAGEQAPNPALRVAERVNSLRASRAVR